MDRWVRWSFLALLGSALVGVGCKPAVIHAPCLGTRYPLTSFQRGGQGPGDDSGEVAVRYLGRGGIYLEAGGLGIVVAPRFGDPLRPAQPVRPNPTAMDEALTEIEPQRVQAILVSSASADAMVSIPPLLRRFPAATVVASPTAAHVLAPYDVATGRRRIRAAGGTQAGAQWQWLHGPDGAILPVRLQAIPYGPAALTFDEPLDDRWDGLTASAFVPGQRLAFAIEFTTTDRSAIAFRILWTPDAETPLWAKGDEAPTTAADAAGTGGWRRDPFDLVIAGPSSGPATSSLLTHTRAAHALIVGHEHAGRPGRERAGAMVCAAQAVLVPARWTKKRPSGANVGSRVWTLPAAGQWLSFAASRGRTLWQPVSPDTVVVAAQGPQTEQAVDEPVDGEDDDEIVVIVDDE